jgi:hypothetical protein
MTDEKRWDLIRRVHQRTKSGQLKWETTPTSGIFMTTIGKFILSIMEDDDRDGPNYRMQLRNSDGIIVDQLHPGEFGGIAEAPYPIFRDTYEFARRSAMGLDKALDDILGELGDTDEP